MRRGQSSHSCCVGSARRTYTTTSSSINEHSRSQKSNHPTCSHPSCAHDDYTQNHGKTATIQEKKGNAPHPCQPKKRHDLPAILRRSISKSNARATGSPQRSVRDKLVNSVVRLRLNRVLRQILFNGRFQTAFHRSKRTTRGTVVKTSFSNVCTMVAEQLGLAVRNEWKTRSATYFRVIPGSWLVERNHVGITWPKGHYRRYSPWVHFFRPWKKGPGTSRRLVHESGLIRRIRAENPHSCSALPTWNTKD